MSRKVSRHFKRIFSSVEKSSHWVPSLSNFIPLGFPSFGFSSFLSLFSMGLSLSNSKHISKIISVHPFGWWWSFSCNFNIYFKCAIPNYAEWMGANKVFGSSEWENILRNSSILRSCRAQNIALISWFCLAWRSSRKGVVEIYLVTKLLFRVLSKVCLFSLLGEYYCFHVWRLCSLVSDSPLDLMMDDFFVLFGVLLFLFQFLLPLNNYYLYQNPIERSVSCFRQQLSAL